MCWHPERRPAAATDRDPVHVALALSACPTNNQITKKEALGREVGSLPGMAVSFLLLGDIGGSFGGGKIAACGISKPPLLA